MIRSNTFRRGCFAMVLATLCCTQASAEVPRYKPSSRSPEPVDITSNRYGASRSAPDALQIGERAPDFSAPRAGGGLLSLRALRKQGPVVIIFYRGHW